MVKDNQHVKIGMNPGKAYKTSNSSKNDIPSSDAEESIELFTVSDPWEFDIYYAIYPQLSGRFRLYLTCNPEFPEYKEWVNKKVDYVKVQVGLASQGKEVVNSYDVAEWVWNSNANFALNTTLDSGAMSSGMPSVWFFNSTLNSGETYCVKCEWGSSTKSETLFKYFLFNKPNLLATPLISTTTNREIKVIVKDNDAYTTALEFYNTATPPSSSPWSKYSSDARALFLETACQSTESGIEYKYRGENFKIWSKKKHTIGINFMASVSESARADFRGYVEQSVKIINDTIGVSGFSLEIIDGITDGVYTDIEDRKGNGEIQLWWGTYEELWDEPVPSPDGWNWWRYYGEYNNNKSSNEEYITEGWIKLCTEKVWLMNFQGITWEEIVECLGIGNDVVHTPNSLFSNYWFPTKSLNKYKGTLTPFSKDLDVLKIAYNHDLPSNIEPWDCASRIYAPNGFLYNIHRYNKEDSELLFDISMLPRGNTYKFKAISLDYNDSSEFTDEISYIDNAPLQWFWSSSIAKGEEIPLDSEGLHPITATEWNNFTARINEFRAYRGVSNYDFTQVKPGDDFTPDIYNEAVNAIKGVSGYGTDVKFIGADTLAVDNNIFPITLFTSLSNDANELGGYTD